MNGFFGLLAGGPDVAVRLSQEAHVESALQQVRFVLQRSEVAFRRANPEARWWKLGPLTQAEVVHVKTIIPQFGLRLEGDQLRFWAAGRFRSAAYFMAFRVPTRHSLDEVGWNSSSMELRPADPPPRKWGAVTSSLGARQPPLLGPALSAQSTWEGRRGPHLEPKTASVP
jgi:hypothetical protein